MELIGQRFGHIRVDGVVGQGGMGDVYAGFDEKLERKVAIKVLNADQRPDADARERLLREARALSKLDHRHICRIHDYFESDTFDLLVLEYIDGTTLDDIPFESLSRSEKLQYATAIASVLVDAHRAGIVHRDLKPENVMITRAGEVKVLDFGLARWLNRARAAQHPPEKRAKVIPMLHVRSTDDTLVLPSDYDSTSPRGTAAGITLGTPLYMSPEQARGDAPTPASDMFSFGLLLQRLFTGVEPHPPELDSSEIIKRVAKGETAPVSGAPRDVTQLITRLKQLAPAGRPAAVQALESLKHMSARPRRIATRTFVTIALLIVALSVWRYMEDLRFERTQANLARAEAEKRRTEAEDLINFMVGDLRKKLEPVGQLEVLDKVAEKTLKYVSDVAPAHMSTSELTRNATVLQQLGDVQLTRGEPPAAMRLFEKARDLSQTARTREPNNPDAQLSYALSRFWIGEVHRRQREYPQALDDMKVYRDMTAKLAREHPEEEQFRIERTYGANAVGMVLEAQGDFQGALDHYKISLAVRQQELRAKPADPVLLADLAPALNKVGSIHHKLGDLTAARNDFRSELEVYRTLVAGDPKHTQWQQRMAVCLTYLALMHWYMGDVDGAHALWREELAIEENLAALDPVNVPWQRNPIVTTRRLANVLEARGELSAAAAMLLQAHSRMKELQEQAPRETSLPVYINAIEMDLARVLAATGSAGRATAILGELIARVEKSSDRGSQMMLARAANTLGEIIRASDPPRAEAAWRRAEQLLEPLVQSTNDVLELDLWCRVLAQRGRCEDARGFLLRLRAARYDTRALDKILGLHGCR